MHVGALRDIDVAEKLTVYFQRMIDEVRLCQVTGFELFFQNVQICCLRHAL